ncbi:MAG TPA: hypothetical protein VKX46_06090 [Ktedonobacteraceae bacterium]|jgi:hypothetical protein|nr:hypothetical protein [Ktedonobacteraceae bacterium]
MKSCMIDNPANTQLALHCLPIASLLEENYFATVPMIAVKPVPVRQNENEEELYTSFEEAISERVARVSRQLERLSTSGSLPTIESGQRDSQASDTPPVTPGFPRLWRARRAITLVCLGLSLLLAGFDLMGLLVLSR